MSSLRFYALREDLRDVFEFILAEPEVRLMEAYSEYDTPLREFRSFAELDATFALGVDATGKQQEIRPDGKRTAAHLCLWTPAMPPPAIERIEFNGKVPGFTHRFHAVGPALIHFHLGGEHESGCLTESSLSHHSEKRANAWRPDGFDLVDWKDLLRVSGRIQRFVRTKAAVARCHGASVLREAFARHREGRPLRQFANSTYTWSATAIAARPVK